LAVLDSIGLSAAEQAIYLSLLEHSPATMAEIRSRSVTSSIAPALAALEAKGLISRLPGRPVRYQAARPDMALEVLVRNRERQLQQVRVLAENLMERFRAGRSSIRPEEIVEVVTTREATVQRWHQLQRAAEHEVRAFDRPPYVDGGLANDDEFEALRQGVRFRCVYDRTGLDLPGRLDVIQRFVAAGEQIRVTTGVPVKMFVADKTAGLISLERPATADSALVIHSSSLLDTLIALFEAVWAVAVPVRFDGLEEPDPAASKPLLGLLAAGLTDEAIARHLGWHPRTVQRHVRALMEELGAQTRFQAGLQAARRGLL
jgi:sugar-specific transcriptional regulator TrmB/DNA-binding CsgD family transcriptional regulator